MTLPAVVEPLIPVLALSALGWALSWLRGLPERWDAGLTEIASRILLPCLLFDGAMRSGLPRGAGTGSLLAFYAPVVALFIGVMGLGRWRGWGASIPFAAVYSNTVIVGVPILVHGLSPDSLQFAFPVIAFHSLVTFTLYQLLAARGGAHDANVPEALWRAVRTPIVASLLLGLAANAAHLTLPREIDVPLSMLASASIPCALLALGASLRRLPATLSADVATVVAAKVVLLPAIVYVLAVHIVLLPANIAAVLVMMAACPVGVNAFALVSSEGEDASRVGAAIFASTAAATATIPLWLTLCRAL